MYVSKKEDKCTQESVEWVEKTSGVMVEMITWTFYEKGNT